jgi:spermidine/putrescine transport system substrate-binding protein
MKRVLEMLETRKEWVQSYDSETKELLVAGDAVVSMSWIGRAMWARNERPSIVYVYLKEDYTRWMDNVAVVNCAPKLGNANASVNLIRAPQNAAMNINYARHSNGNNGSDAFIEPALGTAPETNPPEDAPAPEFNPTCSLAAAALVDRVWTKLIN